MFLAVGKFAATTTSLGLLLCVRSLRLVLWELDLDSRHQHFYFLRVVLALLHFKNAEIEQRVVVVVLLSHSDETAVTVTVGSYCRHLV